MLRSELKQLRDCVTSMLDSLDIQLDDCSSSSSDSSEGGHAPLTDDDNSSQSTTVSAEDRTADFTDQEGFLYKVYLEYTRE